MQTSFVSIVTHAYATAEYEFRKRNSMWTKGGIAHMIGFSSFQNVLSIPSLIDIVHDFQVERIKHKFPLAYWPTIDLSQFTRTAY